VIVGRKMGETWGAKISGASFEISLKRGILKLIVFYEIYLLKINLVCIAAGKQKIKRIVCFSFN
jgi:hypothetical protein